MERSRDNVNRKCDNRYSCSIPDMGNSRPLCPEDCGMCRYNPGSELYRFLMGPK